MKELKARKIDTWYKKLIIYEDILRYTTRIRLGYELYIGQEVDDRVIMYLIGDRIQDSKYISYPEFGSEEEFAEYAKETLWTINMSINIAKQYDGNN